MPQRRAMLRRDGTRDQETSHTKPMVLGMEATQVKGLSLVKRSSWEGRSLREGTSVCAGDGGAGNTTCGSRHDSFA